MTGRRMYTHRRGWFLLVAATVITGASAWLATTGALDDADRRLFRVINNLPEYLRWPLWFVQLPGVLGAPLVIAAVGAATGRFRHTAAAVCLIPIKLTVEYEVIKALVDRPRPGAWISGALLRGVPAAGSAFPSGHAVILFGAATLTAPYLGRRGAAAAFVFAVLAATARIYLGAHTPLDVIGGAACGVAVGSLLGVIFGLPARVRAAEADRPSPTSPTALAHGAEGSRWCRRDVARQADRP